MTWPFILTRTRTHRRSTRASPAEVLKLTKDPETLFKLNPLVVSVTAHPSNPGGYSVKDRLQLLGLSTHTTYTVKFATSDDGFATESVALGWTRSKNKYRVEEDLENEMTVIVEEVTIQGLFLFMPFIISTMTSAHIAFLDRLIEKAEKASRLVPRSNLVSHHHHDSRTLSYTRMFSFLITLARNVYYFALENYFVSLLFIAGLLLIFQMRSNDPYGLFHLTLNKLPNEDPKAPPKTEWLNMGCWENTNIFPDACAALALKLIQSARLKVGGKVLDVGHGTGESLILLLTHPSVPRPSVLTGITSLPAHHRRSQERVARLRASQPGLDIEVKLYAADAVCTPTTTQHPLHPSSDSVFDNILALDCAYHFNTRRTFLAQAFDKLSPGGRAALADICFLPSALNSRKTRLTTSVLRLMPVSNLISTDDYVREMSEIGYVDVKLEDITESVFPGFVNFLTGRGWGWILFGWVMKWYANCGARFVVVSGTKPS